MAGVTRTEVQLRLEAAAEKLLSRPQAVSQGERHEAEKIFLSLRTEQSPYELCQFLLENSGVDYVQFQALSATREAYLREWEGLPEDFATSLWQYLVQFVSAHHRRLANYVLKEMYHVVSILVKRSMVRNGTALKQIMLVIFRILHGEGERQPLGYSLLISLLGEFSMTTGPSQKGLSLEYCIQCKKSLEEGEMKEIFSMLFQVLKKIVDMSPEELVAGQNLVSLIVELTQVLLTWDFTNRLSSFKGFANRDLYIISLKPPLSWRPIITRPDIIELFFALLVRLQGSSSLSHMCLQCLSQLSSLTGPAVAVKEVKLAFVQTFLQQLVLWMPRPGTPSGIMCAMMAVCRRLLDNFSVTYFASIGEEALLGFFSLLSSASVQASRRAAMLSDAEACSEGEETLESVLGIWVRLVSEPSLLGSQHLAHFVAPVVDGFLRSKLTAPDGWREEGAEEDDEFAAGFDEDRDSCLEQLQSVAILARFVPAHVLPQLSRLLCSRVARVVLGYLQPRPPPSSALRGAFEDLHWLLLVCGHVVCNVSRDEAGVIPPAIMTFSMATKEQLTQPDSASDMGRLAGVDRLAVLHQLMKMESQQVVESYHPLMSSLDPVVAIPTAVLQYCSVAEGMAAKGMADVLSPQVTESALWFLQFWSQAYLGFKEDKYDQVSLNLLSAFGEESPLAAAVAGDLVRLGLSQLALWPGEEASTGEACRLLRRMLKHKKWCAVAMEMPLLWAVLNQVVEFSHPIPTLYPSTQRALVVALATASTNDKFFSTMVEEYVKRALVVVEMVAKDPSLLTRLLFFLECFLGLVEGCCASKLPSLFNCLFPLLRLLPSLLKPLAAYGEAVVLILQVFSYSSEQLMSFIPESPDQEQTALKELFRISLSTVELYAAHNASKFREGRVAEEEQCADIVECLRLVRNLSTRDILDFVGISDATHALSGEVVVHGISRLLPLISEDLLQYPSLSKQLYSAVCHVCENHSDEVLSSDRNNLRALLQVLSIAFHNAGPEVCSECLDALSQLCKHCSTLHPCSDKALIVDSLSQFAPIVAVLMASASEDNVIRSCKQAQSIMDAMCGREGDL